MNNNNQPTALIIDDEPDIRELLAITLERMNVRCIVAKDISEGKDRLQEKKPAICLTDMKLPDGDGLDLVEWMQTNTPGIPVAVITAHGNVELAVEALKRGAFDFVSKPLDLAVLRRLVTTALKLSKADIAAEPSIRLLGNSSAMNHVRELVKRVSRSQAPVHISGESGTGKELAARLIHESGPRADKAFIPINCGAVPTELMESEFFGHRKGSFTGAVADKAGFFQAADGGTLFLDEVADLPFHMQVKLLRVIQEKAVRPVGAAKETPVDVRILSATHRDLSRLVAKGEFREDLYYRINVIEVHIPALRERQDDIPVLADHIIARLASNLDMDTPHISKEALDTLKAYDFPGNIRELENVLERALTLCTSGKIENHDIHIRKQRHKPAGESGKKPLTKHLDDVEKNAIVQALEKTRHNKTAAAKLLGISFRALRYRLEKLGLQ